MPALTPYVVCRARSTPIIGLESVLSACIPVASESQPGLAALAKWAVLEEDAHLGVELGGLCQQVVTGDGSTLLGARGPKMKMDMNR